MNSPIIKSAGRVFEILEHFQETRRPQSAQQISKRFGYPLISTSVLLRTLSSIGYLSYDRPQGLYFPTIRLLLLGNWIDAALCRGNNLPALANELADKTSETIMIVVKNDIYSHCVHVVPGRNPYPRPPKAGMRNPLCMSGAGISLLSQGSDTLVKRIYERTAARLKSEVIPGITLDWVLSSVREARTSGCFLSQNMTKKKGGCGVAMPLPVHEPSVKMTIVVTGPIDRINQSAKTIIKTMNALLKKYERGHFDARK